MENGEKSLSVRPDLETRRALVWAYPELSDSSLRISVNKGRVTTTPCYQNPEGMLVCTSSRALPVKA